MNNSIEGRELDEDEILKILHGKEDVHKNQCPYSISMGKCFGEIDREDCGKNSCECRYYEDNYSGGNE
jgi:hypothetical protein